MEYQKIIIIFLDKTTKLKKSSYQNNSETVTNETDKKNLKKDVYIQEKDIDIIV